MSLLWKSDQEDGTYKNPILFADYSDPDVIRVGDTYYMTASSFNYVPGLPILTSKDLVNWELKNYAIEKIDEPMICRSMQRVSGRQQSVIMRDIFIFTTECRMRVFTWYAQKMHLGPGKNRYLC